MERPRPLQSADGEVMPHTDQSRKTSTIFLELLASITMMIVLSVMKKEKERKILIYVPLLLIILNDA